jgi:hypothetical protein
MADYMRMILMTIFASLFLASFQAHACKQFIGDRNLTKQQLIEHTKSIVLVKMKSYSQAKLDGGFQSLTPKNKVDYIMQVISPIKGDFKDQTIDFKAYDGPDASTDFQTAGADCQNHGGFKKDQLYLVFLNSQHALSIRPITGPKDPWLIEVRKILKDSEKARHDKRG